MTLIIHQGFIFVIRQQGGACPGIACDMSGNGSLDSSKQLIEEFAKAGRTGRRNALANVLGSHAECGTGELTSALQQLQTTGEIDIYNPIKCC